MSTGSQGGNIDPMQAAYDFAWGNFTDIELGNDYRPDVPEDRQVTGNTDLFTMATLEATLDTAASASEEPVFAVTDGNAVTTQESMRVYRPIDVGRQLDAAHKIAAMGFGVKPAVCLTRFITDVHTEPLIGDGATHDVMTTDVLELVDTAYEPPRVLETFSRPEVVTTVDDNPPEGAESDILKREFADPTRPDYDRLREELLPEQHTYRGVLGATLAALGYAA